VQARLGVTIPLARLLQDPTIAQLASVVLEQVAQVDGETSGAGAVAAQVAVAAPVADAPPICDSAQSESSPPDDHAAGGDAAGPAAEALARLDQLSDDEVDAMLRRMLADKQ
jgi:hypothetical protein